MSHRANLFGRGYSDRDSDPPRTRFRRALATSLVTIVAPGSAQALLGNRLVGRLAITAHVALIGATLFAVWTFRHDRARVLGWAVDPGVAFWIMIILVAGAAVWVLLFIDSWRLGKVAMLPHVWRWIVTTFNFTILTTVVVGTALTARLLAVQQDVVSNVFTATATSSPLNGRYNILLMGSDSGDGRVGTRPDSLTVVSVDTDTGRTVLVSLPRNLQNAQFPDDSPMHEVWPAGFNCGDVCLINAVYTDAKGREGLYPDAKDPGLEATIDAVEGSTGLPINYYVLVNLQGFESLVDAVGGVTVDVKTRIAMFGHDDAWRNKWLEPGRQKLNGHDALWFARSRYGSDDYGRMARQKCLMADMLDQLNPQTVLLNAGKIGQSGKELLNTSIPQSVLGAFADLALRARKVPIRTVSLVPPQVDPQSPDWAEIRQMIQDAVTAPEPAEPTASASAPADPSASPTPSEDPGQSDDLAATC